MFQRDGIVDENVDRGVDFELTLEEKAGLKTSTSNGKKFNKLAPATEFIEDHIIFKTNEFCYDQVGDNFVEILEIIQINDENYAKVGKFEASKDTETGLWYGPIEHSSKTYLPLKNLSRPFVVAKEPNDIWFVGHEHQNEFPWFEKHVKL